MSKLDPTIGQPESLQIVLYEKKHIYICMYVRKIKVKNEIEIDKPL